VFGSFGFCSAEHPNRTGADSNRILQKPLFCGESWGGGWGGCSGTSGFSVRFVRFLFGRTPQPNGGPVPCTVYRVINHSPPTTSIMPPAQNPAEEQMQTELWGFLHLQTAVCTVVD